MHVVPNNIESIVFKLGITGMGFQSVGISRLCSWDRSSASGLLYFLLEWDFYVLHLVLWQMKSVYLLLECRSCVVGLVVWPVKYGYSLLESVLRFVSLVAWVLSDFSGTTTFFKDFAGAPSGSAITLFLFDA